MPDELNAKVKVLFGRRHSFSSNALDGVDGVEQPNSSRIDAAVSGRADTDVADFNAGQQAEEKCSNDQIPLARPSSAVIRIFFGGPRNSSPG